MTKENLNANLAQIQIVKSLAGSIAHETLNPLWHCCIPNLF